MGAWRFDGTNDRFTVTHGTDLNLSAFTVCAWVYRVGDGGADARIVNKATTNGAATFNFTEQPNLAMRMRVIASGSITVALTGNNFLSNGTWIPVFGVWDQTGQDAAVYKVAAGARVLGGQIAGAGAGTDYNTANLTIGGQTDGNGAFNGYIYAVAIFPRTLTATEMEDYAAGTMPDDPAFLWLLDDNATTQPNEGTVSGYSAANNGATWTDAQALPVTYGGAASLTSTPADPLGITDNATRALSLPRAQTDALGITDSITAALARTVTVTDSVAILDTNNPATVATSLTQADPVGVTDNVTATLTATTGANPADAVPVTDSLTATQARPRSLGDPVGVTDSLTAVLTRARTAADPVAITDTATAVLDTGEPEIPRAPIPDNAGLELLPAVVAGLTITAVERTPGLTEVTLAGTGLTAIPLAPTGLTSISEE